MTADIEIDARPVTAGAVMAGRWAAGAVAVLVSAALIWFFHDRYWYPTDDGFYAHIAERLLAGDVLNRDVQDIHPGYVHFIHAAAFRAFGLDLVSLRYPLAAAGVVQAALVFLLLQRRSVLLATIGAVAATALGVVQFMSPNANWYSLALGFALALWLTAVPLESRWRLPGAGLLLGTLTMFRHLTGVWVAMAVIVLALLERSSDGRGWQLVCARVQILIMAVGLLGYLAFSPETEPGGVLFMAVWPAAVLAWLFVHTRTRNRDVLAAVGALLAGALAAAVPLLIYHLAHGSFLILLRDLVAAGAGELSLPFFGKGWYGVLPLAALHQSVFSFDPQLVVNGVYWVVLPGLSAVNGWLVLAAIRSGRDVRRLALPVIACFHAMVALLLEGPLYLYYTLPLTIVSLLWFAAAWRRQAVVAFATIGLSAVAVAFHAGQDRSRTPVQTLRGERVTDPSALRPCGIERCSLRVSARDAHIYGRLVRLIRETSESGAAILALPNDAELYFLAQRRNPTRFYNGALGMLNREDLDVARRAVSRDAPAIVVIRPADKYHTERTRALADAVRREYVLIDTIDGAEVYRMRGSSQP